VIIEPASGEPTGSVIWLHGLGANGHDFEPIVPLLRLPRVRFVFPHAPEIPVTINGGWIMPAWYDIRTLEAGPDREDEAGIDRSAAQVEALLAREVERGVPRDAIVLAGFSQGGAMALHVGLRQPEGLRGIMALSTYLVVEERLQREAHPSNHETPMLFCHGRQDPLVPVDRGRLAHDTLATLTPDRPLRWHDFAMGHEVCPQEVEIIAGWLQERFAGNGG